MLLNKRQVFPMPEDVEMLDELESGKEYMGMKYSGKI